MASDLTVKARIIATDEASAVVGRVQGRFASFATFLSSKLVLTVGDVARGFSLLGDAISFAFREAAANQQAATRLSSSLSQFGALATKTKNALDEQAAALAATTTATDTQVTSLQALVANLGAAPSQIESVTAAAIDLSAALGVDLETAARALALSLAGNGRAIAALLPELRGVSEEALKSGAAIDAAGKFSGASAAQVHTLTGALGELKESFAELAAAGAQNVVQNDETTQGLLTLAAFVRSIAERFREASTEIDAAGDAAGRSDVRFIELSHGTAAAALGIDAFAAAEERAARIAIEFSTAHGQLVASLAAAGVTLRDFDSELLANEQAQLQLQAALRATGENAIGNRLALAQLAEAHARIVAEAAAAAQGQTILTGKIAEGADAADGASESADGLAVAYQRMGQQAALATLQVLNLNATLGIQARDRRNQAEVDAAVAAGIRPTFGGTRIQLPGGGSRLVNGGINNPGSLASVR